MANGLSDVSSHLGEGLLYLLALILSICVHEFGHAFVADRFGDPLPRRDGRVTLNPLNHIDPIGTILMPLLGFYSSLASPAIGARILGWGKPVRVSQMQSGQRVSPKLTHLLIALAGPGMNLLFALILSALYVAVHYVPAATPFATPVAGIILMNVGLAGFNLLPCPPLDGGAILHSLLPRSLEFIAEALNRYGFLILLALLMTNRLGLFLRPVHQLGLWWLRLLTGWVQA